MKGNIIEVHEKILGAYKRRKNEKTLNNVGQKVSNRPKGCLSNSPLENKYFLYRAFFLKLRRFHDVGRRNMQL